MERISQALQLPVVVERGWAISCEFELLEKLDFLRGRVARQRWILQEGLEPRLFVDGWDGFPFHELKFFGCPGARRRFRTISIANVARSMSHGVNVDEKSLIGAAK
jgi:hypothetical protein